MRCWRSAARRRERQPPRGLDWLQPRQVLDVARRLGGAAARRAAGRLGLPVRQPALSRPRRHRRRRHGDGPGAGAPAAGGRRRFAEPIARGREWIVGHAEPERRLGRVRRRQHPPLPEPHPVRRSRRAARSADRRRHRALRRRCWRSSARRAERARRWRAALDYLLRTSQEADGSWFGRWGMNYIYGTWSVLCALNAAGVDRHAPAMRRAVGWLLAIQNADGGWGEDGESYKLDYRRLRAGPEHRLADRLGAARPDGGRRGRPSGGRARHRLSVAHAGRGRLLGRRSASPRPASRASSTCATTAIRNSSRSGRWRATAT